jgi:hypothetical protein
LEKRTGATQRITHEEVLASIRLNDRYFDLSHVNIYQNAWQRCHVRMNYPAASRRVIHYFGVIKLQPVQVMLERTPGERIDDMDEIIGQLKPGQIINPIIKIVSGSTYAV